MIQATPYELPLRHTPLNGVVTPTRKTILEKWLEKILAGLKCWTALVELRSEQRHSCIGTPVVHSKFKKKKKYQRKHFTTMLIEPSE